MGLHSCHVLVDVTFVLSQLTPHAATVRRRVRASVGGCTFACTFACTPPRVLPRMRLCQCYAASASHRTILLEPRYMTLQLKQPATGRQNPQKEKSAEELRA
eukprot:6462560-Amphidinium_carterae.2